MRVVPRDRFTESEGELVKSTNRQLAARLRRDAIRYRNEHDDEGDMEFARVIFADYRALNAVANLIASGDLRAAHRRASRLDTVVRDAFSKTVWNALSGGCVFGHEEAAP